MAHTCRFIDKSNGFLYSGLKGQVDGDTCGLGASLRKRQHGKVWMVKPAARLQLEPFECFNTVSDKHYVDLLSRPAGRPLDLQPSTINPDF